MEENDILNHFLDASTEIESAEQVAKSVVGNTLLLVYRWLRRDVVHLQEGPV